MRSCGSGGEGIRLCGRISRIFCGADASSEHGGLHLEGATADGIPSDAADVLIAAERGGTGPNGKPSFTADQAADELTHDGHSWSPTPGTSVRITHSFRDVAPFTMPGGTGGFSPFSAEQIASAETALRAIADVANIEFVPVGTVYSAAGQIVLGKYTTGRSGAAAFACYPKDGDVWVNSTFDYNVAPGMEN